eukprot:2503078-Prymnesium_polylepis.2
MKKPWKAEGNMLPAASTPTASGTVCAGWLRAIARASATGTRVGNAWRRQKWHRPTSRARTHSQGTPLQVKGVTSKGVTHRENKMREREPTGTLTNL